MSDAGKNTVRNLGRTKGASRGNSGFTASRTEPDDSDEDFPTPPWATRAMLDRLEAMGAALRTASVWEPAANRGHMVRPLCERFGVVMASDLVDYGAGFGQRNFLTPRDGDDGFDWVITNPPYNLSLSFAQRALDVAHEGVALFQRMAFAEGVERYTMIFDRMPPTDVMVFAERVVIHGGVMRCPDRPYLHPEGVYKKPTTAAAYAWFVWRKRHMGRGTRLHWVPPGTRFRCERPHDYPEDPRGLALIPERARRRLIHA